MSETERGLYESIVTEALASKLRSLEAIYETDRAGLDNAEAADRIALHLSRVIERAISSVSEENRVSVGTSLARRLIDQIVDVTNAGALQAERPLEPGEMLRGILGRLPDGRPEHIELPLTPLLDTTLLTNAPDEPGVGHELQTEINSADRIDAVIAFIRYSGIRPMLGTLRRHCESGRALRILTTTYTGSTEARALDELAKLGAQIRVSYDSASTRLHAKTWLFHRQTGFSTAYIGSSNLTHSAQVTGLEWNVRVSNARNPSVVSKVEAVFESYWNNIDFVPYNRDQFIESCKARDYADAGLRLSPIELRPEPFQEHLLEQIELARQRGRHRNLLVSATGTGKTVMAALDYARLRRVLPRARLLFVAHREEILTRSLDTFRHALRDLSFGELWVNGHRPLRFDHVFASIQSLGTTKLGSLKPEHFDIVIVDEFHHAAASTYQALLNHIRPVELLGLTATPERSDGLPILEWFDGRIAAELRLWDAIDQHRLVPFVYYGIHDGLDLRAVPWRRGRGYDVEGLSNLMTGNDVWARRVVKELADHCDNVAGVRALGFCVSVQHARFMARIFKDAGIAATAIWSDTDAAERKAALEDLANRRVNVVFSVDLFNEGIDVPAVDTLLMLRPTDSPVLFLQQLGRGLRRHEGKPVCTVLDFVGHHRQEFRFDRRLRALLGGSRAHVASQVQLGFPYLPAGCHMELDPVARDIVLKSIKDAVPSRWNAKVDELRALAAENPHICLKAYLESSGIELDDIYHGNKSWSDLVEAAGLPVLERGPHEDVLRRACGRLLHIDDEARINAYRELLMLKSPPDPDDMAPTQRTYLRMLTASVTDQAVSITTTLREGVNLLWGHPQVISEILGLLDVLEDRVNHLGIALIGHPDVPLTIHGCYTRIEILAAFNEGSGAKTPSWREGVKWAKSAKSDLLAFTLNKTSGNFSPTTRYRDYAISPDLIHWESQSLTRADSETGLRYRNHAKTGSSIMLFARLRSDDRAFYFLGPATYVKHESELPMAITWRLHNPLPGDLFTSFAAAVA